MIKIIFPQLNNHTYEIKNPDYQKPMKFYFDEAIIHLQKQIPEETKICLTINDQEKDMSQDLIHLQINTSSNIKIILSIQIQITITFQTMEEKVTHVFNSFDNLFILEKLIKKTHNLVSYDLNFFYKQQQLRKDISLKALSIQNDSVINCQIMGTYSINYQVEQFIMINIFSTIDQVYQQIQNYFHLKQEFQLYFQDELLKQKQYNRDMLFYEYKIKPYSEIRLKLSDNFTIQIHIDSIKMLQHYMVSKNTKIGDLKNYLIEQCQIDKHCQYQLFIKDQILSDDYQISELTKIYKINYKQLNKIFTLKVVDKSITFYICKKELDDFKIRVIMNQNNQIQDLQNLKQLEGYKYQFYFNNQILNNHNTFKQINLNNHDIIYYEIQPVLN
ncbi:unnamed protein product [Paramecium primaurelia]|uniref:Ubiquitin-like domain-containing protein n=1 Tax=Paramecium primaurelia TaxID=5886 RepID=A0A8S1QA34_PARPR|nr:unnamed protein product [Paramecium primaurelia]